MKKKQVLKIIQSQKPVIDHAVIHSIDENTASIRIGSSVNVIRNVECVGGVTNLYPGATVNIAWVDNRPIVLSNAEGTTGPRGATGPQGPRVPGTGAGVFTPGGRLCLTSGTPLNLSDETAKGTVYYTPYVHDYVMLYDGDSWDAYAFSEMSIVMSSGYASGKNYDVFCYLNSGSPALETLEWTGNTTRATALAYSDGRLVKSGNPTRLYLGTFRCSAANQTEDSLLHRYVWNMYNREQKAGKATGLSRNTDGTLGQLEFVVGIAQSVYAAIGGKCTATTASYCALYLLVDTSSVGSADANAGLWSRTAIAHHSSCSVTRHCAAGYHYVQLYLNVETTAASLAEGWTNLGIFC